MRLDSLHRLRSARVAGRHAVSLAAHSGAPGVGPCRHAGRPTGPWPWRADSMALVSRSARLSWLLTAASRSSTWASAAREACEQVCDVWGLVLLTPGRAGYCAGMIKRPLNWENTQVGYPTCRVGPATRCAFVRRAAVPRSHHSRRGVNEPVAAASCSDPCYLGDRERCPDNKSVWSNDGGSSHLVERHPRLRRDWELIWSPLRTCHKVGAASMRTLLD